MPGLFVTLEGIDRSGKSTQAALLADALGDGAVAVREPGGTAAGERVRDILKDPDVELGAEGEALLFAAARAELVRQVIRPALDDGRTVVCDRFLDSLAGLPGRGTRPGGRTRCAQLNAPAVDGLVARRDRAAGAGHRAAARARRRGRPLRARGRRAPARGRRGLLARWPTPSPDRFVRVDAGRDPEAVHADVLAAVREAGRMTTALAGTEDHPHARVSLAAVARPPAPRTPTSSTGRPGVGKRTVARAFAAELLAEGRPSPTACATACTPAPTPT